MRNDILFAIAVMGLFGAYYALADALPISFIDISVNSSTLPKLLAISGGVLAGLLVLQTVVTRRLGLASGGEELADRPTCGNYLRAFGMLAIGAGYVVALPHLGYLISIALLFAAVATYRAGSFTLGIAIFAVLGAIAFHLIFVTLLHVRMPAGILAPLLG